MRKVCTDTSSSLSIRRNPWRLVATLGAYVVDQDFTGLLLHSINDNWRRQPQCDQTATSVRFHRSSIMRDFLKFHREPWVFERRLCTSIRTRSWLFRDLPFQPQKHYLTDIPYYRVDTHFSRSSPKSSRNTYRNHSSLDAFPFIELHVQ